MAIVLDLQHWRYWLEGGDITVLTDHESLKLFRTKTEQPQRIIRFIDVIEHFGLHINVRKGPTNIMANWLSRPPKISEPAHASNESASLQTKSKKINDINYLNYLNRIDLKAIFEHFLLKSELPNRLSEKFVKNKSLIHDDTLYYLRKRPDEVGALVMLKVPEIEDLTLEATKTHERLGHASIGTTMRELSDIYWHPELIIAAREATRTCKQFQLMKPPDKSLPNLMPITPAKPFTRRAIDFTGPIFGSMLLNAIEYSTGWLVNRWINGLTFKDTIPLYTFIKCQFGAPTEMISDNAGAFQSAEAVAWHKTNGTKTHSITPNRPRGNGKIEQANGKIKSIIIK